jgi:hypothetical protein
MIIKCTFYCALFLGASTLRTVIYFRRNDKMNTLENGVNVEGEEDDPDELEEHEEEELGKTADISLYLPRRRNKER